MKIRIEHIIVFIFIIPLFFSCKTIKESDFYVHKDTSIYIPALEGVANIENLSKIISYGKINVSGYILDQRVAGKKLHDHKIHTTVNTEVGESIDFRNNELYRTSEGFVPDIRVFDILKAFSKEVETLSENKNDKNDGTIELEILYFQKRSKKALFFVNMALSMIPSLVGLPIAEVSTSLKLQITIKDRNGNLVKRYLADGKGKAYVGMYYSYGKDVGRKSAIVAFSNAMVSIKEEIKYDKVFLTSALKNVKEENAFDKTNNKQGIINF